tara:strand:- start:1045 stop:1422 length:378 start_codon:yes stop_codon:yes gene_type:complete
MEKIRKVVEKFYKLDISTKTRKLKYVYARAIYFELCYNHTKYTYSQIAKTLEMNHATVLHSIKSFPYMLRHDKEFNSEYYMIRQLLNVSKKPLKIDARELVKKYNSLLLKFDVLQTMYNKLKPKK